MDGNLGTSWFTARGGAANVGASPFFQISFPQDVTVTELRMFGNRESANGFDFLSGVFRLLAADDTVLFDSGVVSLPALLYFGLFSALFLWLSALVLQRHRA